MSAPAVVEKYRADGWVFYYDEGTQFVGAKHPNGGGFSICEVPSVTTRREGFGHAIAALLNGTPPQAAQGDGIVAGIEAVLTSLVRNADDELFNTAESDLEKNYFFRWDSGASIAWNTYKFSDLLELYKRQVRRWEEHHNGSVCVVERVRDKYIMPKVKAFLIDLEKHAPPRAEVSEDARRYHWMIAEWNNPRGHFNTLVVEAFRTGDKAAIDAAIDAALTAALAGGG